MDASVVLASEDPDDENYVAAGQLLRGDEPLATLDLAFYEVTNVAMRVWRDLRAARRLHERLAAIADDGGLIRVDSALLARATGLADEHGISVYDAAYAAAAGKRDARLVSCDVRDLVSRRLARLPGDAVLGLSG